MNRKIGTLSSIAALLIGSSVVSAQDLALPGTIEIPEGNTGYVNAGGNAIRTGLGECLKLGGFSEETQVNACEGIEDVAEADADADADADAEGDGEGEAETEAAPEPEPAPTPDPVEKEPIVTSATLGGMAQFASNSAELTAEGEKALEELVTQLGKFQEITAIEVTGHTDSAGDEGYNQTLSEQRAAVVEAILKGAYPDADITSRGLGESSPVATNSTREGRQLNRRVEVQVTAKSISEE